MYNIFVNAFQILQLKILDFDTFSNINKHRLSADMIFHIEKFHNTSTDGIFGCFLLFNINIKKYCKI